MTAPPPHLEPLPVTAKARRLAPVWPKYARLRGLDALPLPLQYAFAHSVMTPDRRLMLVKNSKAGCTTAAQKLLELAGGAVSDNVHRERGALVQGKLEWKTFQAALSDPATVIFSITRHPVSRAVSAFKDFVLDAGNPDAKRHAEPLKARGIEATADASAKFDIFLDYIEETLALDPVRCDRHWRPQVLNLALEEIRYDRLFPLERYGEGMAEVLKLAGYPAFSPDAGGGAARFNATRAAFAPSPSQEAKVRRLYADDMQALGYE